MTGISRVLLAGAFLTGAATAPALADARDDDAMRLNVEANLRYEASLQGERIEVAVKDGTVVLSGNPRSLYTRWTALDTASRVRGVLKIDDHMQLDATGRRDDSLVDDVRRRLADVPKLGNDGVKVSVADGVAKLSGKLSDARSRYTAMYAAAQVPGITGVVDDLTSGERPDAELQKDVDGILAPTSLYRVTGEVKAKVKSGVVELDGWVRRLWDRIDAGRTVMGINGVKGVTNRLEIRPKPRPDDIDRD